MGGFTLFVLFFLILSVLLVVLGVKFVPQGHSGSRRVTSGRNPARRRRETGGCSGSGGSEGISLSRCGSTRAPGRGGGPRDPGCTEAIAKGDLQAVNYFVAQQYVDALQHIAAAENSKVVLMPLEASSVIGALGGISELTRASFSKSEKP